MAKRQPQHHAKHLHSVKRQRSSQWTTIYLLTEWYRITTKKHR
jgi:hypothetical protein